MSSSCQASRRRRFSVAILLMAALVAVCSFGQVTDGNLVGTIYDASGKVIPDASVGAKNTATGVTAETKSDQSGAYRFNNLPVGSYSVTVSSAGFASAQINDLSVELNKTATANVTLAIGTATESIDVVASTTLIDTTTAQIANIFASRLASDLPVAANPAGGYLNLSLLGAGVASSGGIGAGTGPSVGGQRPRNNNFMVEGTDNNNKDITGPVVTLPNDSVAEFSVLQNQFSAEFGHSSGGQFSAVIRRGSNDLHGTFYDYLENRNLDALDQFWKRQGIFSQPRYDNNVMGGALGGPIQKNKIFYYGNFDYNPTGYASTANTNVYAPTAAGYATLAGMPNLSQTNLNVLKQYVPAAPQQTSDYTSYRERRSTSRSESCRLTRPAIRTPTAGSLQATTTCPRATSSECASSANNTSRIDTGAASTRVLLSAADHGQAVFALRVSRVPSQPGERSPSGLQPL